MAASSDELVPPGVVQPSEIAGQSRRTISLAFRARLGTLLLGLALAAGPAEGATFTVNSLLDTDDPTPDGTCDSGGGVCTLREAIRESNFVAAPPHLINFSIVGGGVRTIAIGSALPAITQQVTIDGYTQGVATPNSLAVGNNAVLLIELDGTPTGAGANGLTIAAANTTLRGLVINRFAEYGILVNATGAMIRGNFVGTDATGTIARGNSRVVGVGDAGIGLSASGGGATIGGTAPADRNLVSGNTNNCARGIELYNSSGNTVQGNYVGTNAAGTAAIANACGGVVLDGTAGVGSDNNLVGGAAAGAGNLLSGNLVEGAVVLAGSNTNTIQGNIIGLNAAGTLAIPNAAEGIKTSAAGANALIGNRIYGNGALGIDLNGDGVTPNDALDADAGPNDLLNFPEITGVAPVGASLGVSFSLDVPAGSYRVEFFRNPTGVDPSGYGEGEAFAGFQNVTHTGGGPRSFSATVTGACSDRITATASVCTDGTCTAFTKTSEFSAVAPACPLYRSVGFTAAALASGAGNALTISGSTATFASALPNNIGVGDAIQYDSDGNASIDALAFIHGRTDAQTFTVRNRLGAAPTAVVGDNNWAIYRAYTSLANWESQTENANISNAPVALRDFDTSTNLVTANAVMNVACYADGVDLTPVTISGWTTDATRYINIFTPTRFSEVGTSQRHSGAFGTGFQMNVLNGNAITNTAGYVRIEGLVFQVTVTNSVAPETGAIESNPPAAADVRISHNIMKGIITDGVTNFPSGIATGGNNAAVHRIWNNVVYDFPHSTAEFAQGISLNDGVAYVFNNTVFNCNTGIMKTGGQDAGTEVRNNASIHDTVLQPTYVDYKYLGSAPAATRSANVSSDASSETAALRNKTAYATYFQNTGVGNLHLLNTSLSLWTANGTDLSAHANLPVTNDIDGGARVRPDIGADEYTATVLFRSVGITATALASGAGNALTISGGTATFGGSLANNIGVGDVIQYDSDGNASIDALAFIHGRTNSQSYAVRDKSGATPTAVIGDNNWSIYRAYTSLAFWESQSENGNILEPVENDVNPSLNLVTANTILHVACYGDGPDTTAVTISGWTTGALTYIHIFTPNLPSQVGITQRHRGVWDDTKYKLDVGNNQIIDIAGAGSGPSDVWIDGLQINLLSTNSNGQDAINIDQTTAANHRISNNIIRATSISHSAVYGIYAKDALAAPAPVLRIWNNIIYGFSAQANNTAIYSDGDYGAAFTVYAYNNTVYGCSRGYYRNGPSAGPFIAKNNIGYNNTDNYDAPGTTFDASSTNNLSGPGADAQMPAGAGRNGVTVTFVDAAGSPPDLHLSTAPADTGAMNWGADLSSDPNLAVVGDIDGEVRQAVWDIGADDANGTTAVELLSFEAVGADAAVDLSWTTASELDNLGFHVYRSLAATGPWEGITSALIPGLGSSPTGATYRYRDAGLANGTTYFYLLEDVETSGRTERHGPVSAIPGLEAGGGSDGSGGGTGEGTGGGTGEGSGSGARGTTYGEGGPPSLNIVERGPAHVVLELVTPGFVAVGDAGGSVRLDVSGFELPQSPGSPAVPVRRALVDALAGRRARITSVRTERLLDFTDLRVAIEGAPEAVVSDEGVVRPGLAPRRAALGSAREGYYPRTYARLLGTAFQGETKKARLELSPLRYDAARGQVVLARRLLVRVDFTGVEAGEESLGGARGRRPRGGLGRTKGVVAQLVTREAGLYKVPFESVFPGRRGVPATSLRLSRRGEAVPFHVEPARTLFGPGSVFYFVGGGDLNPNGDAVYELERGQAATRMNTMSAVPSGADATTHEATSSFEENHFYQAALLDAPDLWLWELLVSPVTKSHAITLTNLDPGATGQLEVWLQGASDFEADPDHHVRVSLNGSFIGEASWDGKREQVILADLAPGILQDGANTLAVENVGDTPATYSMVFLNRFEITQPRLGVAEGGRMEGRFTQSGSAAIVGLSAGSAVLDTTGVPTWLTGATESAGVFRFRVEAGRRYLAMDPAAVLSPEVRPVSSSLRSVAQRADWLLLGPREFLPAAQALVELRREQGLRAKAVALEDVYQQFGFGEKGPEAIRAFLEYTWQSWKKPSPKYVVLLGDSTYDPKDYLGTHVADRLPFHPVKTSYLWTASDPAFAAVNGDDLVPDLAIGRLSAGSLAEAQSLVAKVVAFERAGRTLDGKAVLVADNADLAGAFEADADDLAATVLQGREVQKIYLRDLGPGGTRAEVRGALDTGASLLSYVGHGATAVWASENIFNNQDVANLAAQAEQPLLLTMNCLNGFFHFPPLDSLAEAFVKAEDRGAIAAFSPSGLSLNDPAHLYHKALLAEISSATHARLGDALLAAQSAYADSGAFPELLSIYHLFGDPAMRIRP